MSFVGSPWLCTKCTFENHAALNACEMCEEPKGGKQEEEGEQQQHGGPVLRPEDVVVDRVLVTALLTDDWLSRRGKRWNLWGPERINELKRVHAMRNVAEDLWFVDSDVWGHQDRRKGFLDTFTNDSVKAALVKRFPQAERILAIGGEHVLLAGGAVVSATMTVSDPWRRYDQDLDIFLYGLSSDSATALVSQMVDALMEGQEGKVYRTQYCVSVCLGSPRRWDRDGAGIYQFVLRLYETPDQILGGFDLPCCAVGYNSSLGVVATPLGGFALAAGLIIVDTTRRSPSYESRLRKYSDRGFRIILPSFAPPVGFDLATRGFKLGTVNCELRVGPASANRLVFRRFYGQPQDEEDYGAGYWDHEVVGVYRNLTTAVKGWEMVLLEAPSFEEILTSPVAVGSKAVAVLYERRMNHQHQWSNRDLIQVLGSWYGPYALEFCRARVENDKETIKKVTAKTVELISGNMKRAEQESIDGGLRWITIDPGRQGPLMTGSFHPIWRAPSDFYGARFYRSTFVGLSPQYCVVIQQLRKQHPGWRSLNNDVLNLLLWRFVIPAIAQSEIISFIDRCSISIPPPPPSAVQSAMQSIKGIAAKLPGFFGL